MNPIVTLLALAAMALPAALPAAALRPDQVRFLDIYRELVETNTELSDGSCTLAADKMAARLKAAGFPESDLHRFSVPDHPREGGLVAVLPARGATLKPILLLAHIDVVEAKRSDWARDPFKLIEEDGYFYARGASDDKAMAASWVDTLIRLKQAGHPLIRTVKMALTCGEETEGAFNGAQWLAANQRDLVDAEFALNEGGAGQLDAQGKRLYLGTEAEEKTRQDYVLTATDAGGHSSLPGTENAIYRVSDALARIERYSFPVRLDSVSRAFFTSIAKLVGGADALAIEALLRDPADQAALRIITANPMWNAVLHTTCVPTEIAGGHATNALPQRVTANINCRLLPGERQEEVLAKLASLIHDPKVSITMPNTIGASARTVPLDETVMGPIRTVAARYYPGVPVVATLVSGSTDGVFFGNAGIPTYGVPSFFYDADYGHIHGLNERIRTSSVYEGRDFLYDLVALYVAKDGLR